MQWFNLFMVLGSAFIHVVAHIALKRSKDRTAFMWWVMVWAAVVFSPAVFVFRDNLPSLPWRWIVVSSIFEATYFASIALAYRSEDLSVVYPLARGAAPAFLLLWSVAALREAITLGGGAGILLIALGLYLINLPRLGAWREPLRALAKSGPRWALAAGLSTSLYTAIDKVGVQFVEPMLYTYVALCVTTIWLTFWALWRVGRKAMAAELKDSRWSSVLAGFTTLSAYALVLYAMRMGTPAGYAGAVREFSVVLGTAYGVFVFKERGGPMRLLGSLLVAGGIAMIGLLG